MILNARALVSALTLSTALLVPLVAQAQPVDATLLKGRIFDFTAEHPDFERDQTGSVRGQVMDELGTDGRMIWSGQNSPVYSTPENFAQWYRDTPGVNASRPFEIALTFDPSSGLYVYSNSRFFPIDNALLGNEGDAYQDASGTPRNFHFTTHLAGQFVFHEASDRFSFTGDDDLWVFFDGKLGIDLGGTHPPESAAIDGNGLMRLGLEPGVSYRLDVFHAERHTDGSNFRIETNFDISAPIAAELPSEPRDFLDIDGHKIVSLASGSSCPVTYGSAAEMMAQDGSGARFMAVYCLDRVEAPAILVGTGETATAAQFAALTLCLEEEAGIEGSDGPSACFPFGLAERVVSGDLSAAVSAGQTLHPGKPYASASGAHYLTTYNSGDLAVREAGTGALIWSLQLLDRTPHRVVMQDRGTLAMLDDGGQVIWETEIAQPVPGSALKIDETGVAQIVAPSGEVLWRSDILPANPPPRVSYEIQLRTGGTEQYLGADGSHVEIITTSMTRHTVTQHHPDDTAAYQPVDGDEIVGAAPDGYVEGDEIDPPAPALPDLAVLLTYSINDQVRGAANAAPDYFVAVDGAGEGVIVPGEGTPLFALQDGGRVVFQIADGPLKDLVLIGEDNRAVFGELDLGAFFIVRPPLEPTEGNFASFESEAFPGQYLRHQGYRLKLDPANADSDSLTRRDATFRIEPANGASGADEASCHEAVQGRIAWDYAGSTTWNDETVALLCGAELSSQPAQCFQQVMHGGVEWAAGRGQWAWRNAISLCEATVDAAARVGCFQEQMPQMGWERAIMTCRDVAMGGR